MATFPAHVRPRNFSPLLFPFHHKMTFDVSPACSWNDGEEFFPLNYSVSSWDPAEALFSLGILDYLSGVFLPSLEHFFLRK